MNLVNSSFEFKEFENITKNIIKEKKNKEKRPIVITGLNDGSKVALYYAFTNNNEIAKDDKIVILVANEREASTLENQLKSTGLRVLNIPSRSFVMHNITSSRERENLRLNCISKIISNDYDIAIFTAESLLQFTIPPTKFLDLSLNLKVNEDYSIDEILSILQSNGYSRVSMVSGAGQYSVRGSILDIYSPGFDYPVRCDFFGDTLDNISFFDTFNQRKTESIDAFSILPSKEVILDDISRQKIKEEIEKRLKKVKNDKAIDELNEELELIEGCSEINFADKYINVIYKEQCSMLDYFSSKTLFIIDEYSSFLDSLEALDFNIKNDIEFLLNSDTINPNYVKYSLTKEEFNLILYKKTFCICSMFSVSMSNLLLSGLYNIESRQVTYYANKITLLLDDLNFYVKNNYRILIIALNEENARNISAMLADNEISNNICDMSNCHDGIVNICYNIMIPGYEIIPTKTIVFSHFSKEKANEIRLSSKKKKFGNISKSERIMSYADLSVGDYIVHLNHGIGIYRGIENLLVAGSRKDYIKLEYAGNDKLYIPVDQLDMIAKYIGTHDDDYKIKLSKVGSSDWKVKTQKAKKAAKTMAKELIALYAERLRKQGFAFEVDDEFQRQFEDEFPFEETDGQTIAIKEIKDDMESTIPMDRLLCGDVGYGKTEVAFRAAFKAVSSSKQVAILVPTTILAFQHYQTICSRMRNFPIRIEMLSRFNSSQKNKEVIKKLSSGEVDIVVGTHRLLSKDVSFRDLGLLIVDEEQRFGVTAKEKLKQYHGIIDVLTISATPIPRTLNMSMSGIRDMSILEEPPANRLPVQSYVLEYDDAIIKDAIMKEISRGGQVFYLHNFVDSIDSVAVKLKHLTNGEANIAVIHGQMDKEDISDVWKDMLDGKIDILVCTTIIESGVDIPNANTLIVENANRLGLSQLHQIRGRIGRSARKAYAYFTFPRGREISEIARKRLMAIREYTQFGSGFKVALRDLEIRGAGSLLGTEQHGHIDDIGYDMYMKILNEAVLEEKGIVKEEKLLSQVTISINAYIPPTYIEVEEERIDIYKKIAYISSYDDMQDIKNELLDIYGSLPIEVENLLLVSTLRVEGGKANFYKITAKAPSSYLCYSKEIDTTIAFVLASEYKSMVFLNKSLDSYLEIKPTGNDRERLEQLIAIIMRYSEIIKMNKQEKYGE